MNIYCQGHCKNINSKQKSSKRRNSGFDWTYTKYDIKYYIWAMYVSYIYHDASGYSNNGRKCI
jgi:hypothetical protein